MLLELNDNELSKLIDKMARDILISTSGTESRCCKSETKGVMIAKSYDEYAYAINICKLAFLLITSTYCPYCHMFRHVFTKVAQLNTGKAVFIEVNADYMPEIAWSYNVFSTPAIVVLANGKPIDVIIGYVPFDSFNNYVNEMLNKFGCSNT